MHNYEDLVGRGVSFTLEALGQLESAIFKKLETSGSTTHIKNLQMIETQKAILAIGMFSLFESILQDRLSCKNGFAEAREILENTGNIELMDRFDIFYLAINVLKHGNGRSYNDLIKLSEETTLPFRIKTEKDRNFDDGDVSEIKTLIRVDDQFVLDCEEVIRKVSFAIRDTERRNK